MITENSTFQLVRDDTGEIFIEIANADPQSRAQDAAGAMLPPANRASGRTLIGPFESVELATRRLGKLEARAAEMRARRAKQSEAGGGISHS